MKPTRALQNLKKKLKNDRFYPSDYDRESLNCLISYYNSTEEAISLRFTNYYKIVSLLFLYELRNARAVDNKRLQTAADVIEKIENLIVFAEQDKIFSDIIDEADIWKLFNYQAQNDVNDKSKLQDLANASSGITDKQQQQIINLLKEMTSNIVVSESNKNKNK